MSTETQDLMDFVKPCPAPGCTATPRRDYQGYGARIGCSDVACCMFAARAPVETWNAFVRPSTGSADLAAELDAAGHPGWAAKVLALPCLSQDDVEIIQRVADVLGAHWTRVLKRLPHTSFLLQALAVRFRALADRAGDGW